MKKHFITFIYTFFPLLSLIAQSEVAVINTVPSPHSLNAGIHSQIEIEFNNSIDLSTVNDTTFMVYGRWTGVHTGNITWVDENQRFLFVSDNNFNAGELVTVLLTKNVKGENSEAFLQGYAFSFFVKPKTGVMSFEKKSQISVRRRNEEWIQTYGAFAGDLNKDGYTDFTVPNEIPNDVRVFMNDGQGSFSGFDIYEIASGARPSTNEGADFNLDGNIDLAVGNSTNNVVTLFWGNGEGGFSSLQNFNVGNGVRGLAVLDLDCDGYTDIVTANRVSSNISVLMNNNGTGFSNTNNYNLETSGETAAASADINNDGITDVFIGSLNSGELYTLLSDGEGNLTVGDKIDAGGNVWMVAAGDVNNDGYVDVVSGNSTTHNFTVATTNGEGEFIEAVNYNSGQFPIAIDLGDLDGDEDLDVVLSNYSSGNYEIFENDGAGNFSKAITLNASNSGSCVVLHDRDNDGDLDITGIDEIDDLLILFENQIEVTDITVEENIPSGFSLEQNYPNPFNPTTTIKFNIPTVERSGTSLYNVQLIVYDILGNEITTLANETKSPGTYDVEFDAAELPSGIYFYRLNADQIIETKKMLLLR